MTIESIEEYDSACIKLRKLNKVEDYKKIKTIGKAIFEYEEIHIAKSVKSKKGKNK